MHIIIALDCLAQLLNIGKPPSHTQKHPPQPRRRAGSFYLNPYLLSALAVSANLARTHSILQLCTEVKPGCGLGVHFRLGTISGARHFV
jgi:hypothetical protein